MWGLRMWVGGLLGLPFCFNLVRREVPGLGRYMVRLLPRRQLAVSADFWESRD